MSAFRFLLGAIFIGIAGYTAVTIGNHGFNLMPIFFGDMAEMAWPGQFNFDFFTLLILSGLWVAWRNNFTPGGLVLGVMALFGGGLFLSAYLFYLSLGAKGDMKEILLGKAPSP